MFVPWYNRGSRTMVLNHRTTMVQPWTKHGCTVVNEPWFDHGGRTLVKPLFICHGMSLNKGLRPLDTGN